MIVYMLQNLKTNKRYIGATVKDINVRFGEHCNHSNRGAKTYLHNSLRYHGYECWHKTILEFGFLEKTEMFTAERKWIATLKPEYNITQGGEGGSVAVGRRMSEESKNKISKSKTGKKLSKEHKEKVIKVLRENRPNKDALTRRAENKAKTYIITLPSGEKVKIRNLKKFCIQNGLDQGNMTNVARGRYKSSKGYMVAEYK